TLPVECRLVGVVPGHGAVAEGPEVAARLAADRAYIDALRRGAEPVDARLGPDADWLSGPHQSNGESARNRVRGPPNSASHCQSPGKRSQVRRPLFTSRAGREKRR